jgi:hypothetical protein
MTTIRDQGSIEDSPANWGDMRTEIERERDQLKQDRDLWKFRAELAQTQLDDCRAALIEAQAHHEEWVSETNARIVELNRIIAALAGREGEGK